MKYIGGKWEGRKPQDYYYPQGCNTFSLIRKTKELHYQVVEITRDHRYVMAQGKVRSEAHLKHLTSCKTVDQAMNFADSPHRNEVLQ